MDFNATMNLFQWVFTIMLGAVATMGGFAVRRMWFEIDRTRTHVHEMASRFHEYTLAQAEKSITKDDLAHYRDEDRQFRKAMNDRLDRLESLIEKMASISPRKSQ